MLMTINFILEVLAISLIENFEDGFIKEGKIVSGNIMILLSGHNLLIGFNCRIFLPHFS